MKEAVKIDMLTHHPHHDEFVLYLVESGPWLEQDLQRRLQLLQRRLYDTIDLVLDGHLAERYPTPRGKKIRIQVDLHDEPPDELEELVRKFRDHISTDSEYQQRLHVTQLISQVRMVIGTEIRV
jgi:hypothetical protein